MRAERESGAREPEAPERARRCWRRGAAGGGGWRAQLATSPDPLGSVPESNESIGSLRWEAKNAIILVILAGRGTDSWVRQRDNGFLGLEVPDIP